MARTGLKDAQGRNVHKGKRGGMYVYVDGAKRYLSPVEQKILAAKAQAFDDPITLERKSRKNGIVFNKHTYDPETLEKWTREKGTVPHSRRKLNAEELKAIQRAKNLKKGHEGWKPVHEMFDATDDAKLAKDFVEAIRKILEMHEGAKVPVDLPGNVRGTLNFYDDQQSILLLETPGARALSLVFSEAYDEMDKVLLGGRPAPKNPFMEAVRKEYNKGRLSANERSIIRLIRLVSMAFSPKVRLDSGSQLELSGNGDSIYVTKDEENIGFIERNGNNKIVYMNAQGDERTRKALERLVWFYNRIKFSM